MSMRRGLGWLVVLAFAGLFASVSSARVLRVAYHHVSGTYTTIQAAVDAAKSGDWILVGPGDYKSRSSSAPAGSADAPAAVLITTPGLHIRGMNRNSVVVDGTTAGARCNALKADQNFGPSSSHGPTGLNGVEVFKADNVSVENLTTCNFLGGSGSAGNGVWWNGGDGTGQLGGWGFYGAYLTATSSYYDPNDTGSAAQYGIFSSNWSGGTWDHAYTSNFNDSGFYIGACRQVCNQTVNHAWSEFSALGYSGSNSGGQLVVENSEFDNNQDGFDTNSQNGDNPPPQNGACPNNGVSPITHTHSCWVFRDNYVHDNNNPNVPSHGFAGGGPVGTGMSLSGGRNDTVMDNRFVHNGAWGTILVPFPDSGPPCTGGTDVSGQLCLYDEWGNAVQHNTYSGNGFFGNPTNGDIALTNAEPGPTNCFAGNRDTSGPLTTAPSGLEQTYPSCNGHTVPPSVLNPQSAQFLGEVACDSNLSLPLAGKAPCAPGDTYPRRTTVIMHPLPTNLATMRHPCAGVPKNPWCKKKSTHRRRRDPDHDGDRDRLGQH
ncbi:MAG: hypothetical protein ACR2JH_10230 [Solirubrobacteraceae bacterium]